jgi:hypothetical protein
LPAPELDRLLTAYQALKTRRPDLANGEVLINLTTEIKRAKRTDDAQKVYDDASASAIQLPQIAGVIDLAGERGDVAALLLLCERLNRLNTGRNGVFFYTGSYYFNGPSAALSKGMAVAATAKRYDQVLELLDATLRVQAKKIERMTPAAARSARNRAANSSSGHYQISLGSQVTSITLNFPRPSEYLDETAIVVLRSAYEHFKRADLLTDLTAHLSKRAAAPRAGVEGMLDRLGLRALVE